MMIQDEELRDLYQTTGLERLQNLQMGLLHLEQWPGDQAVLEELRREIHSLKGDSKVMGLEAIARLTQQIEDIVRALQQGEATFTEAVGDRLYQGLQATGELLHEAATGEVGDVDIDAMLALLSSPLSGQPAPAPARHPISTLTTKSCGKSTAAPAKADCGLSR